MVDYYIRKCYGKYYIEEYGKSEGIDSNIISNVLSTIPDSFYLENLKILLEKRRRIKSEDKNKTVKYLLSRGYPYDLIKKIGDLDEER
jgi:SOS response regulatory protein OraA/RecX